MIEINCQGGRIGRFQWENSSFGGTFLRQGQLDTCLSPGRCGWDHTWPKCHAWPVRPWGAGAAEDDYWRDFAAFEPWLSGQLKIRKLDLDLNITEQIYLYDMLVGIFQAGIEAGQNPWAWAQNVEQQTTTTERL